MADGPVRVRLRPLDATAYAYHGGADEVPVVEALLGVPVTRQEDGDIVLSCPVARDGDQLRTAVLSPGRVLVRFDGPRFRFIVVDPGCDYMYETIKVAFTCPCCGAVSYHPRDIEQSYCSACSWWTGDPELGPPHLEAPCEAREARMGTRATEGNLHG